MTRRYRWFVTPAIGLLCSTAVSPAGASCIALSKNPDFVDCRAVIVPPFMPGRIYVVAAQFGDGASAGITGAEFRVDAFPASWFPMATPSPAGTAIGDPFGPACQITFPSCQGGAPSFHVLLYTIDFFPTDAGVHDVQVRTASPPYDPQFDCPVMRLCDAPVFSRLCVTGGFFRFNNLEPCEVAVETPTWSEVKALYE